MFGLDHLVADACAKLGPLSECEFTDPSSDPLIELKEELVVDKAHILLLRILAINKGDFKQVVCAVKQVFADPCDHILGVVLEQPEFDTVFPLQVHWMTAAVKIYLSEFVAAHERHLLLQPFCKLENEQVSVFCLHPVQVPVFFVYVVKLGQNERQNLGHLLQE